MRWGLLILLLVAGNATAIEPDKLKHAEAGALVALGGGLFDTEQAPKWRIASGCAAGMAKELYDRMGYGDPDVKDFAYTCLAAVLSAFVPKLSLYSVNESFYVGWRWQLQF